MTNTCAFLLGQKCAEDLIVKNVIPTASWTLRDGWKMEIVKLFSFKNMPSHNREWFSCLNDNGIDLSIGNIFQ